MSVQSIPNLLQQINNADINNQGVVVWAGENGQKSFEQNLTETLGARGILYFTSTAQMAMSGGSDSGYAVAPDSNGGMNIYRFFPNIEEDIDGAVTSSSAGQWRPIFAAPAPVAAIWVIASGDIVPDTAYLNSGVAIGNATVQDGLALDIKGGLWSDDNKGRAIRIPINTTNQVNAMTLINNSLLVNSNDGMLLRYDSAEGNTKSAGVYAGMVSGSIMNGATSYTFIFSGLIQPHSTNYKVLIAATNAIAAAVLAGGYYITKTGTQFTINLTVAVVTGGTFTFDYQISH